MLADVLDICGLCEQLVHLVADTQLFVVLEVATRQLLLDSGKHLQGPGVLCLTRLLGDVFLGIESTALEDGWPTGAREVARLHSVFKVDTLDD